MARFPGETPDYREARDRLLEQERDLRRAIDVAVIAKAPYPRLAEHAQRRGWAHLRLLSSAENAYSRDDHVDPLRLHARRAPERLDAVAGLLGDVGPRCSCRTRVIASPAGSRAVRSGRPRGWRPRRARPGGRRCGCGTRGR